MKWPPQDLEMFCVQCKMRRRAELRREKASELYGSRVADVLVYKCPVCGSLVSVPAISSGRVYAARTKSTKGQVLELRFPQEIKDLALCVNSSLGVYPVREPYALPLRIGLSVASSHERPSEGWKVTDTFRATVRGRPTLASDVVRRIGALEEQWGAASAAEVARWLIVAAYEAVLRGFASEAPTVHIPKSLTVYVAGFPRVQVLATSATGKAPHVVTLSVPPKFPHAPVEVDANVTGEGRASSEVGARPN